MVTKEEVKHIAGLARLEFDEKELGGFTGDLNNILGYIDQLKEVDVAGVAPLENINEEVETNVFRKDVVLPSVPREEALKNAPKVGDGYFLVPKVIAQTRTAAAIEDIEEVE
jgi:aspartyl-tRNA(Asn)/glutamyl-tRNA(Gln) amidotransferase subunit C